MICVEVPRGISCQFLLGAVGEKSQIGDCADRREKTIPIIIIDAFACTDVELQVVSGKKYIPVQHKRLMATLTMGWTMSPGP